MVLENCVQIITKKISHSQNNRHYTLLKDVKNLRLEVNNQQNVMKGIIDIRVASEEIKVLIRDIKKRSSW